jgi:23S rRNA pseudouridine1911/1915/1917 synthase
MALYALQYNSSKLYPIVLMKYKNEKNVALLDLLSTLYPDSSKTTLRSWIKQDRVTVDGTLAKIATQEILKDQVIEVDTSKRTSIQGIPVLYQDQHIIVIDKPEGLVSVATSFNTQKTAHAILKRHFSPRRVHVVHRLDQETSGVMLFALSEQAYDNLKIMFEKHELERGYTAMVEGAVESESGTWTSYLYEDSSYTVHSISDQTQGRLAITHYKTMWKQGNYSWLEISLETGRKNQIRVHCKDAGHPIAGDKKYGATTNPKKRLCLHAHLLGFRHPITNKPMRFNSTASFASTH